MKFRQLARWVLLFVGAISLHAARPARDEAAAPSGISAEMLRPPTEPFRAGPGDRLEIELIGGEQSRRITLICPDGKLYYDLAEGFDASYMTLDDIRKELETRLAQFYRNPQIAITVAEVRSKRVWLMGRLNKPGIYPLTHPTTIVDAIGQAGGLFTSRFSGTTEELADLEHSFVVRAGRMIPVNFAALLRGGDMRHNIYLQPNDLIYLPSSLTKEIHVLGAVKQPRAVGFTQEMSLAAAIGATRGFLQEADLKRVVIIRGALAQPQVSVIDFAAIQQGKAPNVRLEPRDIVYVPASRWSPLGKIIDLATNTFARTVAANEGNRAATSTAEPIRPQLSVGQ